MAFFLKKVRGALIRVGALNRDYTVVPNDYDDNRKIQMFFFVANSTSIERSVNPEQPGL